MGIRIDYIVHFTKKASRYINFECDIVKPVPVNKGFVVGVFIISPGVLNISAALDISFVAVRAAIYYRVKELTAHFTGLELSDLRVDGRSSTDSRVVVVRRTGD